MASIGYIALIIALISSIYAAGAYLWEARGRGWPTFASPRNALFVSTSLITLSVLILMWAIFTHNFQFEYVASYTSLNSSPIFLFSALWAGNSGSLLFWAWLLSIFALLVLIRKKRQYGQLIPYAAMVMMVTQAFFLILLVAVIHPFNTLAVIPPDGVALNPMLQNAGMVIHPPALLAGYVGFTVPFAFAISALLNRQVNSEWLAASRRWMLLSWLLLGIGNIIGAWWAYVELGWGGYWAWDPVENAGLMPWLLATAFLHSSIMQRRKGTFKAWNMILIILTFCMVIFGTFLTRSGILSSVHTFNESGLEPFFMVFIGIALFGSLILLYYRSGELKGGEGTESLISREGSFLINNVIFVATTAVILIGTIFPTISEAVRGVKLSLDATFFNRMNGPIFLVIILLVGICTLIGWRKLSLQKLITEMLWPLIGTVILAIILFITVRDQPVAMIAFLVCGFVLISILATWLKDMLSHRRASRNNYLGAWWNLLWANTQRYGGYIVHIGIILIAIGVIGSSFYSVEKDATLKVGESVSINQYTMTYNGLDIRETPDKSIVSASLKVENSGKSIGNMIAEKYFQKTQEQPVTEVAIHSNLAEDLYIILESWQDSGATADFKILVNPLVMWMWIGGGIFLLGGLITFWPGKRAKPAAVSSKTRVKAATEDDIEKEIMKLRQKTGKFCPECGLKNREEARFCSRCGKRIPGEKKSG